MAKHHSVLLGRIDKENSHTLAVYKQNGGYQALAKALAMDPLAVIEEVKKSGLRGRGGAGFPTGMKWGFVPRNTGKPVYLVNNADESEPGTFKDRLLLERDPHLVIEGSMIAAHAIGAQKIFIYIRGEYAYPYDRFSQAVKEAYAAGILGNKIDFVVHRGAGAYICGEESAMLESLEGKKGQPRLKPPFPAVKGLYGCPTVINNTETLATIPWIIQNGGAAYAKIGPEKSPGTKLVSASGHINKPGVYEIDLGYPVMDFINNECGGIKNGRKLKALIAGGSSVNLLTADECKNVNMDFESLKAAGSSLGSAGFIVMDDSTDMVEAVLNLSHFYSHESCGQCTPCREGGHWVEKIFQRIATGHGRLEDLPLIESICSQIGGHTICAFGDTMVLPYVSTIKKFKSEFIAKIEAATKGSGMKRDALAFEYQGAH